MGFTYTYSDAPNNTNLTNVTYDGTGPTAAVLENTVKTIGANAFQNVTSVLTSVTLQTGLTTLGDYAFANCSKLTTGISPSGSVSGRFILPLSVTTIGKGVFQNCRFTIFTLNNNAITTIPDYTFSGCINLTSVTNPDAITTIGNYAFSECTNYAGWPSDAFPGATNIGIGAWQNTAVGGGDWTLSALTIPDYMFNGCTSLSFIAELDYVTSIGNYAFAGCTSLNTLTLLNTTTSIGTNVFQNCGFTTFTWITALKTIPDYTFQGCTKLASVTNLNAVTRIGNFAFSGCTLLTTAAIPATILTTGTNIFQGCGFTTYAWPSALKTINDYTFQGCTKLASITNVLAVTNIGNFAFSGSKISNITLRDILTIGKYAFQGCAFTTWTWPAAVKMLEEGVFQGCVSLTTQNISSGVTTIGPSAFSGCSRLSSLSIPATVTSIGSNAFQACGFGAFTWPSTVTSIASNMFQNCTGLTTVTIPATVTSMGSSVFSGCILFTTISFLGVYPNLPTLSSDTFTNTSKINETNFTTLTTMIEQGFPIGSTNTYGFALSAVNLAAPFTYTYSDSPTNSILTNVQYTGSGSTYAILHRSVTIIGKNAFQNVTSVLTMIAIQEGVTTIEENVFQGCVNLTSFPSEMNGNYVDPFPSTLRTIGKNAFQGCGFVTFPWPSSTVTTIEDGTFLNCTALTSLIIPSGVITINSNAFFGCSALASFKSDASTASNLPLSITTIGSNAFHGCGFIGFTWPSTVTSIASNMFQGCNKLTSITVPTTVRSIGVNAFQGCRFTTFTWPSTVTSIASNMFQDCIALTTATIPATVTNMGSSVFSGCILFTGISFLAVYPNLPTLASDTFTNTPKINETNFTTLTAMITKGFPIGSTNTYGFALSAVNLAAPFTYTYSDSPTNSILTNVQYTGSGSTVPFLHRTVKTIEANAFQNVSSIITSVTFQTGVITLGDYAFANCSKLTANTVPSTLAGVGKFNLPPTVTTIGKGVFENCGFTTFAFNNALITTIPDYTFAGCINLKFFNNALSITSIGNYAFSGCINYDKMPVNDFWYVTNVGIGSWQNTGVTGGDWSLTGPIPDYMFYGCTFLSYVVEFDYVTSIGNFAFAGCSKLTSVTNINAVATIGTNAFENCGFINFTWPASCSKVGSYTFKNCTSLVNIYVSSPVTLSLQEGAFYNCTSLKA